MTDSFEPYVGAGEIIELFGMSYGFLNSHSKQDKKDPNRPIMPFVPVGRVRKYRPSEVVAYLRLLDAYNKSTQLRLV